MSGVTRKTFCIMAAGLLASCIAVALVVTSPGFRQPPVGEEVSVSEAEKLVRVWIGEQKHESYWHDRPKLREITTGEIRERLHAQVFQVLHDTLALDEFETYLVKAGRVYPMGLGLGGPGLTEMWVFDIDGDSDEDLVYVYSFGSGIGRSKVEAYRFDGQLATRMRTWFAIADVDVTLRRRDKRGMDIYFGNRRLGELVVVGVGKHQTLDIEPDPELPPDWEKRIWRLPPSE